MGDGTNGSWDSVKVGRPGRIAQTSMGAQQPYPGVVGCRNGLNAKAGNQRVKWQDVSGISRIAEAQRARAFTEGRSQNMDRCCCDQGIYFAIRTVLYQPQNTVAHLTGTGVESRESTACAVGRCMFARCTMTMRHVVHRARRPRHFHALTLRTAKLSRHLPGNQQEQEYRQCRFVTHSS